MISLLDVNVLLALAWPNHLHHQAAHRWFRKSQAQGWATCPITQSGFVRVSSNVRVIPDARTPAQAIAVLRSMTELEHHVFWCDEVSIAHSRWVSSERVVSHHQVTDAHLLALALDHGGRLVTFDRGVSGLLPDGVDGGKSLLVLS